MRSVKEAVVKGKRVLVRVDFNVPLKGGKVVDDSRIRASLESIEFLRSKGAKVILMSHLGRPDGKVVGEFSLAPVAVRLAKLLKSDVLFVSDCVGSVAFDAVKNMSSGDVVLLENLRFNKGEESDDVGFAKELASLGDIFVNDAFGVCHRAHASVSAITKLLPSFAGFLLEKEVSVLSSLLKSPVRPFVAVLGGGKVSDKIGVIKNLLNKVDSVLIGGAMVFTFLKALGLEIGKSKFEADKVSLAKELLESRKIILPVDVVVAESVESKSGVAVSVKSIPNNVMGLDLGPESVAVYDEIIRESKTVFWNGPVGLFENKVFAKGTKSVAKAVSECKVSIIGGGDTLSAVEGLRLRFSHVSTGGGASLEFLEGKKLPGIVALNK